MNRRISRLFQSSLLLLTINTQDLWACDINGKTGFMPENNMKIFEGDKALGNMMTEKRFNEIIDNVSKFYAPVIKKKGGNLLVDRKWKDGTVNASAMQRGNTWLVNMYGGLARHKLTTDDGFALVICHELGHHLGGAPIVNDMGWASNEGQADYFGAMKCLRRVFEHDDNSAIVAKMTIDPMATSRCNLIYKNAGEVALCQRIAMAGKSLGELLNSLGGKGRISFATPDPRIVTTTDDAHPAAQCRLDTYFQATLCDKSYDQDVDHKNPATGVCTKREGLKFGVRPLCWYKPTEEEI